MIRPPAERAAGVALEKSLKLEQKRAEKEERAVLLDMRLDNNAVLSAEMAEKV